MDDHPYPPLTSTETAPIHGDQLTSSEWWACDHPERECDGNERFDLRCLACVLAAQVSLHVDGDREVLWDGTAQDGLDNAQVVRFSWLVGRSLYWLMSDPTARL